MHLAPVWLTDVLARVEEMMKQWQKLREHTLQRNKQIEDTLDVSERFWDDLTGLQVSVTIAVISGYLSNFALVIGYYSSWAIWMRSPSNRVYLVDTIVTIT